MKAITPVIVTLGLAAILAPVSANAQGSTSGPVFPIGDVGRSGFFDLPAGLTQEELADLTAELGVILRFRPLSDTQPIGRGKADVSLHMANQRLDESSAASRSVTSSFSFPRLVARFGVSDRVDSAWGGYDPHADYGLVGGDVRMALIQQGPGRPVSVAIRPSVTTLVGPSDVWAGTASLDISVSRTVGVWSPYAGVATTGSVAIERSDRLELDPAFAEGSVAYAGIAYRWRALVAAAEVEKARVVSYAFRVGTRF